MQTFDSIIKRKGVRSFTNKKINKEQLEKLIHSANASPISGGGYRDSKRHITILQDEELLNLISTKASSNSGNNDPLYGAKTLFILSAPENSFHAEQLDIGIMSQAILLEATDLGLNSILMTSIIKTVKTDDMLISALNIPKNYIPFIGIVVGYTDDETIKVREFKDDNVNYILWKYSVSTLKYFSIEEVYEKATMDTMSYL